MTRELADGDTRLWFADPGTAYVGSRFDWTSGILQVDVDGVPFLTREKLPGDEHAAGGLGLACEFGLRNAFGYDDAGPGGWFSKLGVGSLRRMGPEPYDFAARYAAMVPAIFSLDGRDNWVQTRASSPPGMPFPWALTRLYSLEGRRLTCTSTLENPGTSVLVTEEYCHNFLLCGPGKDHPWARIRAGQPFRQVLHPLVDPEAQVRATPELVTIQAPPSRDIWSEGITYPSQPVPWWELHRNDGAHIREEVNPPAVRMDLWAQTHVVSGELFVAMTVEPGRSFTWQRSWDFSPPRQEPPRTHG